MIQYQQENNAAIIKINTVKLDMYNIPELRQVVMEKLAAKPEAVVLDLDTVEWVDSSAIGFFFFLQNEIKKYDGKLALANLRDHVRKVLASLRALSIFESYTAA